MNKEGLLQIGELSRFTGVNAKFLRYYGRIGILPPAYVEPETAYRYYNVRQLPIVEAIQLCVELGIPLREFQKYYDAENHQLNYTELFACGEALEREKLTEHLNRLTLLNHLQTELCRCEQIRRLDVNVQCRLCAMNLWIEPAVAGSSVKEDPAALSRLMYAAAQDGHKSFGMGGQLFLFGKGQKKLYNYIEIDVAAAEPQPSPNVLCLPEGEYLCRRADSIWESERFFPEQFASDGVKVVMESVLLIGNYDFEELVYELRCSLFCPSTNLL